MSVEGKHTPLPWGIEQTRETLWIGPMRPDGMKVDAVVTGLDNSPELTVKAAQRNYADCRLIVQAVNSYYELLEALRDFRLSVECAAGCDEDAGASEKYDEILKSLGSAVAASYLSADAAISKATMGEGGEG